MLRTEEWSGVGTQKMRRDQRKKKHMGRLASAPMDDKHRNPSKGEHTDETLVQEEQGYSKIHRVFILMGMVKCQGQATPDTPASSTQALMYDVLRSS